MVNINLLILIGFVYKVQVKQQKKEILILLV